MAGTGPLRARLGELVRTRRVARPAAAAPEAAPRGARRVTTSEATRPARRPVSRANADPVGIESFLLGGEWHDGHGGVVYVHERLRSELERPRAHWGRVPAPPPGEHELALVAALGLERVLFLDLETCGLSSSPVFLAGTMHWNGEDFVVRQVLARHYGEEAALLRAVHEQARGFAVLVTFNGKSYDAPFLRARAEVHRVPMQLPATHLDLLHASRRRWRDTLPDCRLQTLERHICRRRRVGDVGGAEVPERYHEFVKGGDPSRMAPVLHHNVLDVVTMAEILQALCRPGRAPRTPVLS